MHHHSFVCINNYNKLTFLVIVNRFLLKVLVQLRPELLLQPVGVEPEQALQSVPEARLGVLLRQLFEFIVHGFIKVFAQEERPEPEQRVHLVRLARAESFAVLQAPIVVLVVRLLREIILLQQRM